MPLSKVVLIVKLYYTFKNYVAVTKGAEGVVDW